jgi:hypothetical protein
MNKIAPAEESHHSSVESDELQIDNRDTIERSSRDQPFISLEGGSDASSAPRNESKNNKLIMEAIDVVLALTNQVQPGFDDIKQKLKQREIEFLRLEYTSNPELSQLSLSIACITDQGHAVISDLLKSRSCRYKDRIDRLALHWAAQENSSVAVVEELLKAYPEGASKLDGNGDLPLHIAARSTKFRVSIFAELYKACPKGILLGDRHGNVPLQIVANNKNMTTSVEILNLFLGSFELMSQLYASDLYLNSFLPVLFQMDDITSSVMKASYHPLHCCIKLSAALVQFSRTHRSKDIRWANHADEMAAELEQLACAIARQCPKPNGGSRSSKSERGLEDCLELAVDLKMKFFISEPVCSERVERFWGLEQLKPHGMNFVLYSAVFCIGTIFLSCFNVVCYNLVFSVPPLLRFLMNRVSFLAFLVCILHLPLQVPPSDTIHYEYSIQFEMFLAYWLFDICFSEAVEFRVIMNKYRLTFFKTIAKYMEDPWNIYDVVSLSTAVAAAFARGFVHAGIGNITATVSNQLYAWALALLWGRLVNVLSVVSFIGPLLIMVLVMIFKDLTKFAFLVVLMELPFVAALYFLESGDGGNEAFVTFPDSALTFFKIVIGQGPDISSVTASSSILLSFGSVLLSVLLLNLLIAMFSKTFDTIVENSTQEYLLQKAQLAFIWRHAPRMPPPLASPLALRDFAMNLVIKYVLKRCNECFASHFAQCCAGADQSGLEYWAIVPPTDAIPPTFDKLHFFRIVFPFADERETKTEIQNEPSKLDEWSTEFIKECTAKYEPWCKQVLDDWAENAEFNSDSQMDKFKSRMLRGMETSAESSNKIDRMKLQMAENAKTTQEQIQALSEAVQSQCTRFEQLHASIQSQNDQIQLLLKKLNA